MANVRWKKLLIPLAALVILNSVDISKGNHKNASYYLPTNETVLAHYDIVEDTNNTFIAEQRTTKNDLLEEDDVDYDLITPSYETHLVKSSIIYGLAKTANLSSVNQECYSHLRSIQKGILRKEPWAMKGTT